MVLLMLLLLTVGVLRVEILAEAGEAAAALASRTNLVGVVVVMWLVVIVLGLMVEMVEAVFHEIPDRVNEVLYAEAWSAKDSLLDGVVQARFVLVQFGVDVVVVLKFVDEFWVFFDGIGE
jgi:disulfide bond formation protein DsbB